MNHICNDQLTCVRVPSWASPKTWKVPKIYHVGDRGKKNGMPYTIKAFGVTAHRIPGIPNLSKGHPRSVWMAVKYKGSRKHAWDVLLIGDTDSMRERLIFGGRHKNPLFSHFIPIGAPQPL